MEKLQTKCMSLKENYVDEWKRCYVENSDLFKKLRTYWPILVAKGSVENEFWNDQYQLWISAMLKFLPSEVRIILQIQIVMFDGCALFDLFIKNNLNDILLRKRWVRIISFLGNITIVKKCIYLYICQLFIDKNITLLII